MTLQAYGREGVRSIVESNCRLARRLGEWIEASEGFALLAPVRLNIVCFALQREGVAARQDFLRALERDGRVYLTPTTWQGRPAIRAAFSNWRTSELDLQLVQEALQDALHSMPPG